MADHGYSNFYTPPEYESYQQYQQRSYEDERYSVIENTLNIFMQQSMINMQNTNQRLKNLSLQLEMMQAQIMENQFNIQSTHDGEIVGKGVVELEEDIMKEIEPPLEIELPQERSDFEETKIVDDGEVIEVVVKKERLLSKKDLIEARGKKVNKVEIDRVIDEICTLFNKSKLRRSWTPHQLYLKFMEFLPRRRVSKDDVLSVSFWPP
jgi:hypothetical protein